MTINEIQTEITEIAAEITIPHECTDPHCDGFPSALAEEGLAVIADNDTGAVYCDANCWLHHIYGWRPALTQAEADAQERAAAWMKKYRPGRR